MSKYAVRAVFLAQLTYLGWFRMLLSSVRLRRSASAVRCGVLIGVAGLFGCALPGCTVKQSEPGAVVCSGPNCDAGSPTDVPGSMTMLPDATAPAPTGSSTSPELGVQDVCPGLCLPDDPGACLDWEYSTFEEIELEHRTISVAQVLEIGDAGSAQAVADASVGVAADASAPTELAPEVPLPSDEPTIPTPTEAGSGPTTTSPDAPVDAEDGGDAAVPFPGEIDASAPIEQSPEFSCQLLPDPVGLRASCALAGRGSVGDACSSGRDCSPGLGCVAGEVAGRGQCLEYCCAGRSSCDGNRLCTERPLLVPGSAPSAAPRGPVCVLPEQCELKDPFPCPPGEQCSCPEGRACSAVGTDGARACVEPGTGMEGEACPCSAGYFCSPAQGKCLELCQFGTESCGAERFCQGAPGFPENWGLCVQIPR